MGGLLIGFFLGDFDAAVMFGRASVVFMNKASANTSEARNCFITSIYCLHFQDPLKDMLAPLMVGYKKGISTGDMESSMWCIWFYLQVKWLTGAPLESLLGDSIFYSKMFVDFGQIIHSNTISPCKQLYDNLINGPQTCDLVGEYFDEVNDLASLAQRKAVSEIGHVYTIKIDACCFFADYCQGADIASKHGDYIQKMIPGRTDLPAFYYMASLCCFAAATETGKAKYLRQARKYRNIIKKWVNRGNKNCFHFDALLDAEHERYRGNQSVCVKLYEKGIVTAGRQGLLHFQALANERLATYWRSLNEVEEESYRLKEAVRLYDAWGAYHKVELLRAANESKLDC